MFSDHQVTISILQVLNFLEDKSDSLIAKNFFFFFYKFAVHGSSALVIE